MLITILSFLGVIIIVILAHEIGHFATAKLAGVKVEEFGLFYPPRLFSIKRGETIYSINALPLGGFVKMSGEEDPDEPGSLAAKSIPVRLLVLSAGSLMNLLLPFLLLSIAFMVPHDAITGQVEVLEVAPASPADLAGIEPGDIILSVNGREVHNDGDLQRFLYRYLGSEIPVVVQHSDLSTEEVRLTPRWKPPEGEDPVGLNIVQWVVIVELVPDSPATLAGIKRGDLILSIDGQEVHSTDDVEYYINLNPDSDITIVVQHADLTTDEFRLTPEQQTPDGKRIIGVGVSLSSGPIGKEHLSLWKAIPRGSSQCIELMVLFKNGIIGMVTGALPVDLRGPVGIAEMSGEFARAGFSPFLEFAAMISINLGIINLFPLPALDGGRLVFVLIELVRRGKRISARKEWLIHTTGFFLLIAAILAVTYRDILRIISGE